MSLKSALRKMSRAFRAKDEAAFESAVDEMEEHLEEDKRGRDEEEDPDAIEIHNHIPSNNDGLGEVPPKDPDGFPEVRDQAPPWFKDHKKAMDAFMKKMGDDVSALQKWAKEEKEEPEHSEDGGLENLGEFAKDQPVDPDESDRNLDEPAERTEMAKRIKEQQAQKDRKAKDDEANQKILGELEFEAPPGTNVKDARKARDSAFLEESFQDVVAKAEILAPGIRVPTFDHKALPIRTGRSILGLRRSALDVAYHQAETRGIIDAAMGNREFKLGRMSDSAVRVLFNAVAAAAMTGNNHRATDRSAYEQGGGLRTSNGGAKIQTIADLNARNREKFGRKSA